MKTKLAFLTLLLLCGTTFRMAFGVETLAVIGGDRGIYSEWMGFARCDFQLDGRDCIVVAPKEADPGTPWIWRARFFGHEPQTDIALLEKGFHLAYMDVRDLFGSPEAVAHWNAFYQYLVGSHGFARRVALEGMSRGGLIPLDQAETFDLMIGSKLPPTFRVIYSTVGGSLLPISGC